MPDLSGGQFSGGLWCNEVLEGLPAYVEGTLSEAERVAVEAHLKGCERCAQFGGSYSRLVVALRQKLGEPAPLEASCAQRLDAHLLLALDEA